MTTIVATRVCMAADRRGTSPIFATTKLFRVRGSIIGIAGTLAHCLRFIEWRMHAGERPEFPESASVEALELSAQGGLILWGQALVPIPIVDAFYAIGTGAPYALGAMDLGASPQRAIAAAARWDENTGADVQTMRLKTSA